MIRAWKSKSTGPRGDFRMFRHNDCGAVWWWADNVKQT